MISARSPGTRNSRRIKRRDLDVSASQNEEDIESESLIKHKKSQIYTHPLSIHAKISSLDNTAPEVEHKAEELSAAADIGEEKKE